MFGTSGRRQNNDGYPQYDARYFLTNDARCNAFDDYQLVLTFVTGQAGAAPWSQIIAAEIPAGFEYTTNLIGLGGTPSPIANGVMSPLVNNPSLGAIYLNETYPLDSY